MAIQRGPTGETIQEPQLLFYRQAERQAGQVREELDGRPVEINTRIYMVRYDPQIMQMAGALIVEDMGQQFDVSGVQILDGRSRFLKLNAVRHGG